MPGIVAIIDAKRQGSVNNESLLRDMASSITHENWQKTDMYSRPPLAIARVHLGITNTESQPIFNEDKSICIFMEGNVFGYDEEKKELELRGHKFEFDNDPEFCLHLFEEYGEAFVKKLDGSFVLVIFDIRKEKIVIANDRHSLRPLFYTKNRDRYLFSSEVKAILRDKTFKKDIDHEAVANFFAFGRILVEKKTFFKRVRLLPPASLVIWEKGKVSLKRYWNINYREEHDPNLTEDYYIDTLVNLWLRAVEKRARGRHRFGLFLSGGLDSRAIATSLVKRCYPVHTFTYGIDGGDEAKIAEKVARKLETQHKFFELKSDYLTSFAEKGVYLTDGMVNCVHFWWISLLQRVRKDVDVMFHGHGQDILLGTYFYRLRSAAVHLDNELLKAEGDALTLLFYKKLNSLIPEEIMPSFFSETYYQKIRNVPFKLFKKALEEVKSANVLNKIDCFYLRSMARDYWSVMMLRNFVEDRVVGFDSDFFEFAIGIPPRLRSRTNLYYKFITKLSPEMAKIPYQKTGVSPRLPILVHRIGFAIKGGYKTLARMLKQKTRGMISLPLKMGYPDIDEWIRKDKKTEEYFRSVLLDERTLSRGYFNREFIARMINEHKNRSRNWGIQLCALLTFELWNRFFIDSNQESTG
jgi:asparagine synthase (glutamine-hydrolysing)